MFRVNDEVMFRNRCQNTLGPMRVEAVDTNMFDTRYKVQGKWWAANSLMRYSEWKSNHLPTRTLFCQ